MVPSAALGTTFVLHHSEADNLNTRVLCGTFQSVTTPIKELRFLLRQGRMVFYPPPCGLSYVYRFGRAFGVGLPEFEVDILLPGWKF
jgi:hypothetical protein